MTLRLATVVLSVLFGVLAGCGGGGGGGESEEPVLEGNFFPLAVGDRWIYVDAQDHQVVVRATQPWVVDGKEGIAVVTEDPGGGDGFTVLRVTPSAVEELLVDSPDWLDGPIGPVTLARFPLRAGDRFVQVDKTISLDFDENGVVDSADVRSEVEVVGLETVTVPVGTLAGSLHLRTSIAIVVQLAGLAQPVSVTATIDDWYAPDIGQARSEIRIEGDGVAETSSVALEGYRVGPRSSDTIAPTVTASAPADGSLQPVGAAVTAAFSESMDAESLRSGFVLRDGAGRSVAGFVQLDGQTARFTPSGPLTGGRYVAVLGVGVTDRLGNPLATERSWSFEIDTTGPGVVASTPAAGAVDVSRTDPIVVRFSEPLDPASASAATISLGGHPIDVAASGDTVTVTPTTPLARNQPYTLILGTGIRDAQGNPMADVVAVGFRTDPGRFGPAVPLPSAGDPVTPNVVAIGDVNGDGRPDVVGSSATSANTLRLLVYLQGADGALAVPVEPPTRGIAGCHPSAIAIGDADGDGRDDVVLAEPGCGIEIFNQTAAGSLVPGAALPSPQADMLQLVDLDGDGRLDLVAIGRNDTMARVWRQDGTGAMVEHSTPALTTGFFPDAAAGDVNGDGRPDIVAVSATAAPAVSVLLQGADGRFASPLVLDADGSAPFGAAVGDVNGDGRSDIVITPGGNSPTFIGIFLQQADGTLAPMTKLASYDIPAQVEAVDIDNDGRADIVVAHAGWSSVGVYLQRPDGTLGAEARYPAPTGSMQAAAMAIGDINGDGRKDVVLPDGLLPQRAVSVQTDSVRPGVGTASLLKQVLGGNRR